MKITFWGVRGSLPTPPNSSVLQTKLTDALHAFIHHSEATEASPQTGGLKNLSWQTTHFFGGNTSCVSLEIAEDTFLVLDSGSGITALSRELMQREAFQQGKGKIYLFMSHLHWDHIMGFPFFIPAYRPGNVIEIHGIHTYMEEVFETQQNPRTFPSPLNKMPASISFHIHDVEDVLEVEGLEIRACQMYHPNKSYSYRISNSSESFIYATDSEFFVLEREDSMRFVDFFQDADYLVFDSQYSLKETVEKMSWGHSSALIGVDYALAANVKNLILFHHDPNSSDEKILSIEKSAQDYAHNISLNPLHIKAAYEGMTIDF